MRSLFLFILTITSLSAFAQSSFYGVARKNNPANEVFLATINPATGVVTNLSNTSLSAAINVTGAALNPYAQTYHYLAGNEIKKVDLSNGNLLNSQLISNPSGNSYFDNFRFNNSDSLLYGLARRIVLDTVTMNWVGEVYLATINPATGVITQISDTSLGQGYALAGSAINPYLKVFYFSLGDKLAGVDMYTGDMYSLATVQRFRKDEMFDNFTYSCVDTSIYGLIRDNYFTSYYDSTIMDTMSILDSTSIRLARINPATGQLTVISPYSIASGGYSLNSGSTIDPAQKIFYYNNGYQLVGVSLTTGLIVSQPSVSNVNGQFFELMRIESNCEEATKPTRLNPNQANGLNTLKGNNNSVRIYPNPVNDFIQVNAEQTIDSYEIYSVLGECLVKQNCNGKQLQINVSQLTNGIYFLKLRNTSTLQTVTFTK